MNIKTKLKRWYNKLWLSKSNNYNHIFIACLPKSGSTFLADSLVNITEYSFVQFQPIRGTNDHNINHNVLNSNLFKNTVTQLHAKPNSNNKKYLLENNIKVVFLYRNITSSLKSFYNHILNEENQWFMFTVADNFKTWHIERQFDFLIDMVVPWYINFLTAWENEIRLGEMDILALDYDDFILDNEKALINILDFYEISNFRNQIETGLLKSYNKKDKLRYNDKKNKTDYSFTEKQISRIKEMTNYYSEFSIKI